MFVCLRCGLGLALAAPTAANAESAGTIVVPCDFDPALSDTRATGHYELLGSDLHLRNQGSSSTDKVAEYVQTSTPLAEAGEPALDYDSTAGGVPGFQLVVDFDNDGSADGILIGEPGEYGNDWWLHNAAQQFVMDGAPSHTGGSGSANHGTLDQWRSAFPNAQVVTFGFSLGSSVQGEGVLDAISFAGTRYEFVAEVRVPGKNDCKNGGWTASNAPVFKNQGDCVSSFASTKSKLSNFSI